MQNHDDAIDDQFDRGQRQQPAFVDRPSTSFGSVCC
jgi:hypothetical protein